MKNITLFHKHGSDAHAGVLGTSLLTSAPIYALATTTTTAATPPPFFSFPIIITTAPTIIIKHLDYCNS